MVQIDSTYHVHDLKEWMKEGKKKKRLEASQKIQNRYQSLAFSLSSTLSFLCQSTIYQGDILRTLYFIVCFPLWVTD